MSMQKEIPGFDRKLEKHEINALPSGKFPGRIHLVNDPQQISAAVEQLRCETVLGFDTETRPAFRKGERYDPSLIQLSGVEDAYIFQLRHCGFPKELAGLLEEPQIIKTGVGISRDVLELQALASFQPAGFVELSEFSKKNRMKVHGLRGLAAALLGIRLSKKAQLTNWARSELSEEQLLYAASDAWVSREIYLHMQELGWIAAEEGAAG